MILIWFFKYLTALLGRFVMVPQPRDAKPFAADAAACQHSATAGGRIMFSQRFQGLLAATMIAGGGVLAPLVPAYADQTSDIRQAYVETYGQQQSGTILEVLARLFQEFDSDGEGITSDSIAFVDSVQTAARRASFAAQWLILIATSRFPARSLRLSPNDASLACAHRP
jgi:hypothetical protein